MVLFKSPHFVVPTPKCHPGKSPGAGSNRRPRPYQGRALPTELPGHTRQWSTTAPTLRHHSHGQIGAGNGTRTRDPELGRLALYQLSYSRKTKIGGEGRIRTFEGIAGRFTVCSLWPLGNLSLFPFTPLKQLPFFRKCGTGCVDAP